MKAALRFSRQARADLTDIWCSIARHDEMAADRLLDRIEDACWRLREFPHLGRLRLDLDPDGRVLIVDRWLVLYRSRASEVFVVRVLDGRRDLTKLLSESP